MTKTQQCIQQLIRDAQGCDQAASLAALPSKRAWFATMAARARAQARQLLHGADLNAR
jgi:hypothetical protein